MSRAVVLLSGGLDSTTTLGIALSKGMDVYPISFDYGQRHSREMNASRAVCQHYGLLDRYKVIKLDMRQIGGSALTDDIAVPEERDMDKMAADIPITYVPARNLIFISIAAAYAETRGANIIYIGANAVDYSGYPDCRPEFIESVTKTLTVGTKLGVERGFTVEAPLISMTKAEIIKTGMELGVPYELTWSCYKGGEKACGKCDSCRLRLRGFKEAGYTDPIEYE